MTSGELVTTILGSVGGSAVIFAGLATFLGKVWMDRISRNEKLMGDIDLDLRSRRIAVYSELWKATEILPKWPRAEQVTYEQLYGFSKQLRDWYFRNGGMYLSRNTHKSAYGPLQDELSRILKDQPKGLVKPPDYDSVRDRCSQLRSALAEDIESRRGGPS
jgi:hypothetical protein